MQTIMKKIIRVLLASVVFALATVSCDVERLPYDVIESGEAFQSVSDAENMNNGLYAQLRNRMHGIQSYSTDIQADLLNATWDYGNRQGFPHRWTELLATDYTIRDVWQLYYSAINNVNNIIENQHLIEAENAQEQAQLDRYLGEAYFLRAYYFNRLAIRYGELYDPASAESDLGIALVLQFDIRLQPARASVAETYRQILDDLAEAKRLLANVSGAPSHHRISLDAALALETRVHLHMQNWSAVIPAAEQLINSGTYPLITTEEGLRDMWHHDTSSEVILQVYASHPNELGSSMVPFLGYRAAADDFNPDWIPNQWAVDLFEEGDIRKNVYFGQLPIHIDGIDYYDDGLWLVNKYPGNPALYTGNTNYQHKPKVFRMGEIYMNLAEAQYYVNEANALATLNALRVARGLDALSGLSGQGLLEAIQEERTRELMFEGWRLDDLHRWGLPVDRTNKPPQHTGPVIPGEDFVSLFREPYHHQMIYAIPSRDLTTNPNMVQNPGW